MLIVVGWLGSAQPAWAYSSPEAYAESPASGGGGGRFFTGSPADGFGCGVCHGTAQPEGPSYPLSVTGLATQGFELGERREIVLSWPEFAAKYRQVRPDPTAMLDPEAPLPAQGLSLELIAESGRGSGTIEIHGESAGPGELCEQTRPNLAPRLAANLYQVRPGVAPLAIRPDGDGVLRCTASQLGHRCVIALTSCGSSELRFVWTAPSQPEGAIWFSAGFVASEAISGTPEDDSAFELTFPMEQRDSASGQYETTLRGQCGVALPGLRARGFAARGIAATLSFWGALLGLVWARRRRRGEPR